MYGDENIPETKDPSAWHGTVKASLLNTIVYASLPSLTIIADYESTSLVFPESVYNTHLTALYVGSRDTVMYDPDPDPYEENDDPSVEYNISKYPLNADLVVPTVL